MGVDVGECVGELLDHAMDLTVRFLSDRADLSASAAFAMNRVCREGPIRLTALAAKEGVSQPSMTQLMQRLAMMGSQLIVLAQMGSTIAIGLLVDTLIVRSLLIPSIATFLGRWFWWPLVVYPRGDNHFRKPTPPSDDADTSALPVRA